jgi:hypothetical protein
MFGMIFMSNNKKLIVALPDYQLYLWLITNFLSL